MISAKEAYAITNRPKQPPIPKPVILEELIEKCILERADERSHHAYIICDDYILDSWTDEKKRQRQNEILKTLKDAGYNSEFFFDYDYGRVLFLYINWAE